MSDPEPVWSYRGYQLRPGDFTTAMVHFFRAEISRANVWRTRLDTTTNWAVISTGAMISFAFAPGGHQGVILLNAILVTMFLIIETRRYRYYDLWSSRVRLMETDFFAAMLVPPFSPSPDWAESLAESLLQPHFSISRMEALGRRLRRNYLYIYFILGVAHIGNLALFPDVANSAQEVVQRAGLGPIPGFLVLLGGFAFFFALVMIALLTRSLHEASGEVMPRFGSMEGRGPLGSSTKSSRRLDAWFRKSQQRKQLLAIIITDKAKVVSDKIIKELNRGVTSLPGTGMYTGKSHDVLMVALTVTEVEHLKSVVRTEDENAFVIVSPAQGVYGRGFSTIVES